MNEQQRIHPAVWQSELRQKKVSRREFLYWARRLLRQTCWQLVPTAYCLLRLLPDCRMLVAETKTKAIRIIYLIPISNL